MTDSIQPFLNSCLNATAACLLICGYVAVRRKNIRLHKAFMLSALAVSAAFLSSYLIYHFQVGHLRFAGDDGVRKLYLAILLPHLVLAVVMVPMIIMTFIYAFRGMEQAHRRLARITLPIWLYVSVTGVVLYIYMYKIHPDRLSRPPAAITAPATPPATTTLPVSPEAAR